MEDNITQIRSGLHQDNSFIEQPKDKLRFALNAISETNEGDQTFIANEESNELCFQLPDTYIPLGQVYIGNNETVIFSVKDDETLSEIGIADADCNYTTIVNADLGFTLSNQIDATFRLRRGCERVIYWVDPKIRFFNIDRPENFKTPGSSEAEVNDPTLNWVINSFFLFKRFEDIPRFSSFNIEEEGNLKTGSYSFAFQYVDADLNPTQWLITSHSIPIYNDALRLKSENSSELNSEKYSFFVTGSTSEKNDYLDFPNTNKSIVFTMSGLDLNFPFYRIAIIEYNNGTGQISGVKASSILSTNNPRFSYSGDNFASELSIEEVQTDPLVITEARNIEQIENRLVLGNVKNSPVNFCKLQKYASKIKAVLDSNSDGSTTLSNSNQITGTSKDPLTKVNTDYEGLVVSQNGVGYTPGEIYSFGIRYLFEDGTFSPVFHIPGSAPTSGSDMDTSENELTNTFYTDNSFCEDYWGVDSEGVPLKGKNVRHHRFPLNIYNNNTKYGIRFFNIETPSLADTNNLQVKGYQIVQQERNQTNSTILDAAFLTPVTVAPNGYKNNSVLFPENTSTDVSDTILGYYSPKEKFTGEVLPFDEVIQVGEITTIINSPTVQQRTSVRVQDVAAGTSYDPSVHRRRERDNDGFDLHVHSTVYEVGQSSNTPDSIINILGPEPSIEDKFSLAPMESFQDENLYNTISDNKSSFVKLNGSVDPIALFGDDALSVRKLPIVLLKRNLSNPYANFREDPYYPATTIRSMSGASNLVRVYNGDWYNNRMFFTNTNFFNITLAKRKAKRSLFKIIAGVLSTVIGVVLVSTGVGAPAGIAAIGFGISQVSTGVKLNNIRKVLEEEYEAGLFDSVILGNTYATTDYGHPAAPPDDEIRWMGETMTDLDNNNNYVGIRIGSNINVGLRVPITKSGITDFIKEPVINDPSSLTSLNKELGYIQTLDDGSDNGFESAGNSLLTQEKYLIEKLTIVDHDNQNGLLYKGFPNAEFYKVNPDYAALHKSKILFHLPLQYDCCSDCVEEFKYRIHYSQQSFQEELVDNYTSFLPNNFRDIEGEKGVINDIFKIQNNLYIHTEEALFHLPQNVQERITGDIVSFIGTGDFFSIPPRKIVDHDKSSAGTLNKWGRVKTPYGVFFVSLIDRTIYKFSGESLEPISNNGLFNWFKENIPFNGENDYNGNIDNPSNPNGLGFVSVYDSRKERIIITKKDFTNPLTTNENNSWTISYSLKDNSFTSWHSYLPSFYFFVNNEFFSWNQDIARNIYKHNVKGLYQSFYGTLYPHIIEYVSNSDVLMNKIFENIVLHTEAKVYDVDNDYFINNRDRTFNKAILYNSRQCSGELTLFNKDTGLGNPEDYFQNQVRNFSNLNIPIDNNEGIWTFNGFRDIVTDLSQPLFIRNIADLQSDYFIDKILNDSVLDENKDWTQQESLRDKYLVVRLIFDNFTDTRLITNYSIESENKSFR